MQIISVITQAMDMARRKFTRGEQLFLIDIFNSTVLTPGILGQHLKTQVEDSFADMPGEYEEKWKIEYGQMIIKIDALDFLDTVFLELWAVGYWAIHSDGISLEDYIAGKVTLQGRLSELITRLEGDGERLERTKGSFKSPAVAEVRADLKQIAEILGGMI